MAVSLVTPSSTGNFGKAGTYVAGSIRIHYRGDWESAANEQSLNYGDTHYGQHTIFGAVKTGDDGGDVVLQWAQRVNSTTVEHDAIVFRGSYVKARRVA